MSSTKRTVVAVLAAVLIVAAFFTALTVFPLPTVGRAAVIVGFPLGYVILKLTPEGFFHWLAPEGGPDAVSWAFAASTLVTWFIVVFVVCYFIIGRMRSNSALLTDTYTSPLRAQRGAAKRER